MNRIQCRSRWSNWILLSLVASIVLTGVFGPFLIAAERNASETKPKFAAASGSGVSDQDIVSFIDAEIRKGWADAGYTPSTKATDGEWCRRAFLDIIGRVPTTGELARFLADPANARKQKLLDRLLDGDDYTDEYASYWGGVYTNLLVGRPKPREERTMINRSGMQNFLRTSFARGKPYDQMAYELVSATGVTDPDSKGYNGATNFIASMAGDPMDRNLTQATSKTSKMFMGVQVQCTQCHNHPFNDWKQDQFWSMNAFFRQTKARVTERSGRAVESAVLENTDFRGEGSTPDSAEIYFELRNGTMAVAYPTFVDGTKINPNGSVKEVDRRAELGKLIIKSEFFGKAVANRLWSHFLGYGFTKPVDDMGPHNPASHPELLDRLGKEFSAHGHDFKKLVRWIVLTEAYGLSSFTTPKNKKDDPSLGEKPKFSHFYLRQMQPEQLYESLHVLKFLPKDDRKWGGTLDDRETARRQWLTQFTVNVANDEGEDQTTFNGTIPQVLMMMNGPLTKEVTSTDQGGKDTAMPLLVKLVAGGMKPSDVIDYLYLATYSRKPTAKDQQMCMEVMSARGSNAATAYQDIFWSLLNSNEFIFIH